MPQPDSRCMLAGETPAKAGTTADGHQFCAMDYVRGSPLHRYVRDRKLTLEDALKLFGAVCDAVNYAHQRGIIHRDLKPSNILVDSAGVPKVLDFGLAKLLGGSEPTLISMTGQVMGTLPYMSPEQTRGNPDEIDVRTDVYALGVVRYEMLTGHYPYPVAGQMAEVFRHIAETPPTPPTRQWTSDSGVTTRSRRRMRPGQCPIDDEVQTIVLRTLAKERERRYRAAVGVTAAFVLLLAASTVGLSVTYQNQSRARQDPEEARASEEDQRKLAERRAAELETVTEFQASMLGEINAELMGRRIITDQRDSIRERMQTTIQVSCAPS